MKFTKQHLKQFLMVILGIITLLLVITFPIKANSSLTEENIRGIASITSVVIGQDLQSGDNIETKESFNSSLGSGVIVAKDGDTYYALTNVHVVRTRDVPYGVRTYDGKVHIVDDINTKSNIIPFGEEEGRLGNQTVKGFDLALIKFKSNCKYDIAPLDNSNQLKSGDKVYVYGWPHPNPATARRESKFSDGIVATVVSPSPNGGYNILYNNETAVGMSGGPVFNEKGEIVGTHGRGRPKAENTDNQCSSNLELNKNNSCGIQSSYFIDAAKNKSIQLQTISPPIKQEIVKLGMEKQPKASVIEDIYQDFTGLSKRIGDCPSDDLFNTDPRCRSSC